MSFTVTRIQEYTFECDNPDCNNWETLHTGEDFHGIYVHNTQTAFKVAGFHKTKGMILCDECFKKERI